MTDIITNPDPFTMVYDGLWDLVDRNPYLRQLLPARNKIKFDEDNARKDSLNDADLPELQLLSDGGLANLRNNSSQSSITRNYIWQIATGDNRINPIFNKICFELYRSMFDWECTLCNLLWCDCRFVTGCRLVQIVDGNFLQDIERNIPGWSSLWSCEVDFVFPKQLLRLNS